MGLPDATASRELLPGLEDQPGHLMWRAAARVTVALDEVLPPGVDIHAYAALLTLAGGATRSQQSIADTIDVSRTTMVKVAAELADQGLVERVRNPDDRRSYALTRTPEGAAAARRWRRHAEDLEEALTPGFSLGEREELRRLLLGILAGELAPDTPEPLLESLGFLITRVHLRMHRAFSEALAPLGIVPAQFGLLTALATLGPVPQAEVGRRLGHQRGQRGADGRPPRGARAGRATAAGVGPAYPGPASHARCHRGAGQEGPGTSTARQTDGRTAAGHPRGS